MEAAEFKTNFKWQSETRHEAKARKCREAERALDACYRAVDARDGQRSRLSGVVLTAMHGNPDKCLERHHMVRRGESKKLIAEPSNVITLSKTEHSQVKAGKLFFSGDANARDAEGRLCGVLVERNGEGGWEPVGMI